MPFLRNLLAAFIALILFAVITVIIIAVGISSDKETKTISTNTIFKLKIDDAIADRQNSSELNLGDNECTTDLENITDAIEYAIKDTSISEIQLHIAEVNSSLANIQEIKVAIESFRATNRKVIVFSDGISQIGYYLATSADSIYTSNMAHFEWKGLGAQLLYFKSMLEKIGVKAEPVRVGKFKSAIEPYILDTISKENHHQVQVMINDIWKTINKDVNAKRSIPLPLLDSIANNYGYLTPPEALKFGFIDGIKYQDQINNPKRNFISLTEIIDIVKSQRAAKQHGDKIALVYAEGAIIDNESQTDISAVEYGKLFDDILKDKNIKGLVIRINSPGGSAKASEKLWRKIKLIQAKMPVYVSMGNVAASGGYYMATAADSIFAMENTITGSIGVFGLMFNVQELAHRIGVNVEKVKTNELSDFPSFDRSLTGKEKERLQSAIKYVYGTFIERVEEGRKLDKNTVENLASGRVWTGNQAFKNGLIDEIGGLEDALTAMKSKIGDNNINIVHLPKRMNAFEKFVQHFTNTKMSLPEPFVQYNYLLNNPEFFKSFKHPQTRLPYLIEIN